MDEEALFHAALALPNLSERDDFLKAACAGMPELYASVGALLQAHEAFGSFLDPLGSTCAAVGSHSLEGALVSTEPFTLHPEPSDGLAATVEYRLKLKPGVLIAGRYILMQRLGEGGMGEIWVAQQTEPVKRRVALKLIKTGMDSKEVLTRFEHERQALAMMDHPNIAKVFDAGTAPDGQPFFVMELVNGLALNKFCDKAELGLRERLELFVPICHAVQHAHQKGIVHRDLKPANILVTLIDGKPVPKVIDFGVAKATAGRLTDQTLATQFGAVVGTLEYMSPEQAAFSGSDVDTRADIYSLGVVLYELLIGLRPFDSKRLRQAALTEVIRILLEEDPSKPSTRVSADAAADSVAAFRHTEPRKLAAMLRGELDWIVMKCLEKERERRYQTANGLARDIQRYLDGDAVEACPPSVAYRTHTFVRKHKTMLITATGFVALLAGAAAVSTWQAVRAHGAEKQARAERDHALKAEQRADRQRLEAVRLGEREHVARNEAEQANTRLRDAQRILRLRYYATRMNLAQAAYESNDIGRVRNLLDQVRPQPGEPDLRGFEWDYWQRLSHVEDYTFEGHQSPVHRLAYSPDGLRIVSADWAGRVVVWEAKTGRTQLDFQAHVDRVNGLTFSPDGLRIASASSDKTIKIWDALTGKQLIGFPAQDGGVFALAFSPDGARLASGSTTRSVKIWDASDGRMLHEQSVAHSREVTGVTFSPDGRFLASCGRDGLVKLWNAESLEPIRTLTEQTGFVQCVAFSPDSRTLVTGDLDRLVRLWDVATGNSTHALHGHEGAIYSVAFSPDGRQLASAGADQTIFIWDAGDGRTIRRFLGHSNLISSVAYSPDGRRIASCGFDKTVKIWSLERPPEPLTIEEASGAANSVAFSPDGLLIASGGNNQVVQIRQTDTGESKAILTGHKGEITCVRFSPDGRRIASVAFDHRLRIWDVVSAQPVLVLEGLSGELHDIAFSPDGRRLVADSLGRSINVRDATTGQVLKTLEGKDDGLRAFAFSPDGRRLAAGGDDQVVRTWDMETGRILLTLKGHSDAVGSIAYSHDGRWLGSSSGDGTTKIWDATTGRVLRTLTGHSGRVRQVAFSPDDRRLASASDDRTIKFFDTASGEELLTLKGHGGWVHCLAFSPDGRRLASASFDRAIKIWNASPRELR